MSVCNNLKVDSIEDNECLSDSLLKINNNFINIQQALKDLNTRFDERIEVRTFFYYGPNASSAPGSGMDDSSISRPSDITIQAFVNSPSQLNLPAISSPGDIAYVIYQKTGYLNSILVNATAGGSQQVVDSYSRAVQSGKISSSGKARFINPVFSPNSPILVNTFSNFPPQVITQEDIVNFLAPIFIIWRLTSNENSIYTVDSPTFPKFFRSQTANISEGALGWQNWNNPQNWSQF
jgi:hypothetical protein